MAEVCSHIICHFFVVLVACRSAVMFAQGGSSGQFFGLWLAIWPTNLGKGFGEGAACRDPHPCRSSGSSPPEEKVGNRMA